MNRHYKMKGNPMIKKVLFAGAIATSVFSASADAAGSVDPLQALAEKPVSHLDWGLFKASFYLEEALGEERGSRIQGSKLDLKKFWVDVVDSDKGLVAAAVFSGWASDLSSGSCADALIAFKKYLFSSAGTSSTGMAYIKKVFGGDGVKQQTLRALTEASSIAVILGNRDGERVRACRSDFNGQNIRFKVF